MAFAAALALAAGCGGTLEDDFRQNEPTRGTGPAVTTTTGSDSEAFARRRPVRSSARTDSRAPDGPTTAATRDGAPPAAAKPDPGPPARGPTAGPGAPKPPGPGRAAAAPRPAAPTASTVPVTSPPPPMAEGVTATIVVMGGAIPLSGPLGAIGRQELYGFDARVQRINDAGGIHGRRLKLVVYDDGLDPARDRVLFRRLVEEDHVFSAFAAGSTRAVADYACRTVAQAGGSPLPLVADVAILPEPQIAPQHRCIFNTGPGTRHAAWVRAQKAKALGASSIGVIMSDHPVWDAAAAMAAEAEAVYEREGLEKKGKIRLPLGAPSCDQEVRTILAHGPQYLFLNLATTHDLKLCVAAMRKINWKPAVATELALPADEVVADAGPFAEGFLSTSIFYAADDPAPAMAEYRADLARYHPDADGASPVTLSAYLGAKVTGHLLHTAGRELSRPAFLRAAESLTAWDSGMGPVLTWSPTGRVGTRKIAMLAATEGRFVHTGQVIESACPETACAP